MNSNINTAAAQKYVAALEINSDRRSQDHPHITGSIIIEGVEYRVGLWYQIRKDKTGHYYSGALSETKDSPKFRITLYAFRGNEGDPNYHTVESKPFVGPTGNLHGYLWIVKNAADALEEFTITLELTTDRRSQQLTEEARSFKELLLRQVGKGAEADAERANELMDDINCEEVED